MRVAIRRLRSAFSVFGRLIDPAQRARLSDEAAKTIVSGLGPARDWDVFLAELLAPVRAARQDDAGLLRLAAAAEAARHQELAQARGDPARTYTVTSCSWDAGSSIRLARSADRAGLGLAGSADRRVRHPSARQAPAQGVERGAGVRATVGRAAAPPGIALKKLRYATEFFEALYPKKHTKPYLAALKDLQDGLGHLNDVAVAQRLIAAPRRPRRPERRWRRPAARRRPGVGWHARGVADRSRQSCAPGRNSPNASHSGAEAKGQPPMMVVLVANTRAGAARPPWRPIWRPPWPAMASARRWPMPTVSARAWNGTRLRLGTAAPIIALDWSKDLDLPRRASIAWSSMRPPR